MLDSSLSQPRWAKLVQMINSSDHECRPYLGAITINANYKNVREICELKRICAYATSDFEHSHAWF